MNVKHKVKWKLGAKPAGGYRGIQNRAWPSAFYPNGEHAVTVFCVDPTVDYRPYKNKPGDHPPLKLIFIDHSQAEKLRKVTRDSFKTLAEAKAAFDAILEKNPQYAPKDVLVKETSE